jgi:curved DNA-binding protein
MAVEFKDYYKILGVERTASDDELRKAFRSLARKYHPDVAKDKKTAEDKFKEINEAYEVLSDPEKRKRYDTLGANWDQQAGFRPPPGWEQGGRTYQSRGRPGEAFEFHFGGTGFSDFFEQFFGARGGPGYAGFEQARGGEPFAQEEIFSERGRDVESDLLVTLQEAIQGAVRTVSLRKLNPRTGEAELQNFRVRIPAGVHEGKRIRVPGKGAEGVRGGGAGDLFLRVKLEKHPDFRVQGSDLYHDLELAPWEAVLGTAVRIPTLEGPLTLKIPPGTNQGQKLRVRGQGLPMETGRGNLYAVVSIQVPTHADEEEKKLWEQLAKKTGFNPRK